MRLLGFDFSLARTPRAKMETRNGVDVSDLKDPSAALLSLLIGAATNTTGITVTPLKALGVASVFACIRVRSDAVATLPLRVMQREGRFSREAPDHPLWTVLHDMPNEEMTSVDARAAMQMNLCFYSKCYAEILRDIDGDPVGLYPYESPKVDFFRSPLTKKLHYKLSETGAVLAARDMVHIRNTTLNGLQGLDTINSVREVIALAIALQENAAKFFGNGSQPGGVLEHPNSLSTEAQERLKTQIETQTGGRNTYRLLVLEEGLKYVAQRTANKDSQFDESRMAQDLNICRIYAVPPHKIGIMSGQPRANVEQDNLSFVTDVVRPDCVRYEQTFNAKLLSPTDREQGYYIKHDFRELLRGDMKSRFDSYAVARQWGWLSANDVRELEDLPKIEGGDVYLQPLNMADTNEALSIQQKSNVKGAADSPGAPTPIK